MYRSIKPARFSVTVMAACTLISCASRVGHHAGKQSLTVQETDTIPVKNNADGLEHSGEEFYGEEEKNAPRQTRIRFPHFTVVVYGFKGYETEGAFGQRTFYGQFDEYNQTRKAYLNDDESETEGYTETLVALTDTVILNETLDERINNTLFQVVPGDRGSRFRFSYCYLSRLNEVIDHRHYLPETFSRINFDSLFRVKEVTPFYPIKDSARYYFRAMPHMPDMVEMVVKEGEVVPKKMNTQEQLDWESRQWENETTRIKKKYGLRDTLVIIPGEYSTEVLFTKDKKLFSYGYEAFLFRIERYTRKKLAETKYLVVYIAYGC